MCGLDLSLRGPAIAVIPAGWRPGDFKAVKTARFGAALMADAAGMGSGTAISPPSRREVHSQKYRTTPVSSASRWACAPPPPYA